MRIDRSALVISLGAAAAILANAIATPTAAFADAVAATLFGPFATPTDSDLDWLIGCVMEPPDIAGYLLMLTFLFGGFPLGLCGLGGERWWWPLGRSRLAPYFPLASIAQIVATGGAVLGLLLGLMTLVVGEGWLLATYMTGNVIASAQAIPAWRRLCLASARRRADTRLLVARS